MANRKRRPFMTDAAKRSKTKRSKMPHGNKGQIRIPSIRSRPVVLPLKERAQGLSLDQVVKLMPYRPDIFNANNVFTVTSFKGKQYPKLGTLPGTGNKAVSYITVTKDEKGRRYHRQLIYARDPNYKGRLIDCPQIVFSCDCERWKYMWEYAVWRKGAAEVVFGNGEPPKTTNPRMRNAVCKHIFRVRKGLRKRKW